MSIPCVPLSDFPSDVLKWMKNNSVSKPKTALKLIKCHKYFQHLEFPYFVVTNFDYCKEYFGITTLDDERYNYREKKAIEEINKKFWITQKIMLSDFSISTIFPKIAVCDVKVMNLGKEKLSFDEFKFLTASGNTEQMFFYKTLITFESGDPVFIEDILKCIPSVTYFKSITKSPIFSANFINTFHQTDTSKMQHMWLDMISYSYFEVFRKFMDKNPHIDYHAYLLDSPLSHTETEELKKFIQNIIDEACSTENIPPYIAFTGQDPEQLKTLKWINERSLAKKRL